MRVIFLASRRSWTFPTWRSTIDLIWLFCSPWKMMNSSILLMNSGLKWTRTWSVTRSLTVAGSVSMASRIEALPMFEVRMMTAFLKLTTRPCESVTRPSSRICSRMLKTSPWAFSISSKRMTAYGRLRTASVSWPPSSYPTYPGGAPTSLLTVCFSMYSDMSMRTMAASVLNMYSASALASSVFPTPVGPRNMNEAIGLLGSDRPARDLWMASATASTASSWPMTRLCSSSDRCRSFSLSDAISLETGMPVHLDTISPMSASVTSGWSMRLTLELFSSDSAN
mmetsp:Transcript_11213/g.31354  ORF Transcript_11213/g.31354 Transcript_11213/m.31354 type:complete len:282 (+) Transcript_11213:304-1149(+)